MNQFIADGDNLDEQLSVVEFIKTLKKVDSDDTRSERDSIASSSVACSTDKLNTGKSEVDLKKIIEKKNSSAELLQNMRKRFVHRATEPIFHNLEIQKEQQSSTGSRSACGSGREQRGAGGGSEDGLKMPQFECLERKTDSAPSLRPQSTKKYETKEQK
ncbi:hypothetical protein WR25_02926 [Diploscapter pachys]|uniref:Uncharacterized protein n=1 Tax=Diploscapter pachys TaxID=2018661 RepID=A0A2A2JGH8_9BILA|nr:hypothetical protein WR25_02926 [Diploscapter pachys]